MYPVGVKIILSVPGGACSTDVLFINRQSLTQKEIHNNVVPDRVKSLSDATLHHQRKGALEAKVLVLLEE